MLCGGGYARRGPHPTLHGVRPLPTREDQCVRFLGEMRQEEAPKPTVESEAKVGAVGRSGPATLRREGGESPRRNPHSGGPVPRGFAGTPGGVNGHSLWQVIG